jgi:hypothetical protein
MIEAFEIEMIIPEALFYSNIACPADMLLSTSKKRLLYTK